MIDDINHCFQISAWHPSDMFMLLVKICIS
uniref:Uncharacterized protein n=1 Tax=Arundo donax TaxID=35708 RepID=A0A0A9GVK7_ARUDO